MTECTQKEFEFQGLGKRRVVADFGGGEISSDAGGLLIAEVEKQRGWIRDLAGCFVDYRDPVRCINSSRCESLRIQDDGEGTGENFCPA